MFSIKHDNIIKLIDAKINENLVVITVLNAMKMKNNGENELNICAVALFDYPTDNEDCV